MRSVIEAIEKGYSANPAAPASAVLVIPETVAISSKAKIREPAAFSNTANLLRLFNHSGHPAHSAGVQAQGRMLGIVRAFGCRPMFSPRQGHALRMMA
jgi:hypothetical protein